MLSQIGVLKCKCIASALPSALLDLWLFGCRRKWYKSDSQWSGPMTQEKLTENERPQRHTASLCKDSSKTPFISSRSNWGPRLSYTLMTVQQMWKNQRMKTLKVLQAFTGTDTVFIPWEEHVKVYLPAGRNDAKNHNLIHWISAVSRAWRARHSPRAPLSGGRKNLWYDLFFCWLFFHFLRLGGANMCGLPFHFLLVPHNFT